MKKLSKRGSLLLGVLLAVCAFVPALASAASWSPVGTTHQLTSNDLAFTAHTGPLGTAGSICQTAQFDSDVTSAATLRITGGRFDNCHGIGGAAKCPATPGGDALSGAWAGASTTTLQIRIFAVAPVFERAAGNRT